MSSIAHRVAVRALCGFTAKTGDLDLRFTPSPTAQQGIDGHAEVASRRGPHYQREISLTAVQGDLNVRGRADGYDPQLNRLEEIKTHRGDLSRLPENHRALHWAQAKIYAAMMCEKLGLSEMQVALIYFDVGRSSETVLCEQHSAADLAGFFTAQCAKYLAWAQQEAAHREARNAALQTLAFPHPEFRHGQRRLAESVYKANTSGRCLMLQAPTGIGKTVGTVFASLKAMPGEHIDKLFYLTAKTPGRQLALDAVAQLAPRDQAPILRTIELVARDKACEHPDLACHGDSCPLAKGFYDRLPAARQAAARAGDLSKPKLRQIAVDHHICPYYLGQEMVRWSDVVVGDYNHYFDVSAMLHGLTQSEEWRVSLLLDEAHNLLDRARLMYTAQLSASALFAQSKSAPKALRAAFGRVCRQWQTMVNRLPDAAYQTLDEPPEGLLNALQKLCADVSEFYADEPTHVDARLQSFYFDALHFLRINDSFGTHSLVDLVDADGGNTTLTIRNVVPGPHLKDRWRDALSASLFSATLTPHSFVSSMLSLPEATAWVDVDSAFSPDQLQVSIARRISTRYRDREHSLAAMVELMATQYQAKSGNYLAFFSSFDYLNTAAQALVAAHSDIPVWQQSRNMSEADREAFLAKFTPTSQGIAFAVLGGAFAEGIDLPGARLIGAFIATLGLAQFNPLNEAIKARVQTHLSAADPDSAPNPRLGDDYTYLFPGIQKVTQAAGRVIRTPTDQGVVHLMDDRFGRNEVLALLPKWWRVGDVGGFGGSSTQRL